MGFLPFSTHKTVEPFTPPEQIAHTSRCIFFPDAPLKLRKKAVLDPKFNHDKNGKRVPSNYVCFKEKLPFCCRKSESRIYTNKYEDMIPIIAERFKFEKRIPPLANCQFLIPKAMTVGQLQALIKKNMGDFSGMAVYLLVANKLLPSLTVRVDELYSTYRDEDGFLYINFSSEETFG